MSHSTPRNRPFPLPLSSLVTLSLHFVLDVSSRQPFFSFSRAPRRISIQFLSFPSLSIYTDTGPRLFFSSSPKCFVYHSVSQVMSTCRLGDDIVTRLDLVYSSQPTTTCNDDFGDGLDRGRMICSTSIEKEQGNLFWGAHLT